MNGVALFVLFLRSMVSAKCCTITLPHFSLYPTYLFKVFCICTGLIKNNFKDEVLKNDTFPGLKRDLGPQIVVHLGPRGLNKN